jgi:RNA recognition motif-containing protein
VLVAGETRALKLGDRTVDVSRARALHAHKDAAAMDPKTLYVLGLTEAATKEGIRALFEPCGAVADVRLMRDREGALRGFCYVEFEDANGAAAGLSKDREVYQGKRLKVPPPPLPPSPY